MAYYNFLFARSAQLRLVVCDDSEKAIQIMNTKSSLEYLIVIENITDEVRNKAAEMNIKVFSFDHVKEIGKKNLKAPIVSELERKSNPSQLPKLTCFSSLSLQTRTI